MIDRRMKKSDFLTFLDNLNVRVIGLEKTTRMKSFSIIFRHPKKNLIFDLFRKKYLFDFTFESDPRVNAEGRVRISAGILPTAPTIMTSLEDGGFVQRDGELEIASTEYRFKCRCSDLVDGASSIGTLSTPDGAGVTEVEFMFVEEHFD